MSDHPTEETMVLNKDVVPSDRLRPSFRDELKALINCHSRENGSDTPDFILAEYLESCLDAFDKASGARDRWYSRQPGGQPTGQKESIR